MASKVLLDANVLLDFTLKRKEYEKAKQIMVLVVNKRVQAYITPSLVHIMGYWLTKEYGYAKAKELLLLLLSDIQVIDINHETTLYALHSRINDIEDALQYYTAMAHHLNVFISRDKALKKAALSALPIFTPDEFLKEYGDTNTIIK